MLYYKLFHVGYIESHEILKDEVVHVYSYVGSTHSIMMADLTEAYVWFLIFIWSLLVYGRFAFAKQNVLPNQFYKL